MDASKKKTIFIVVDGDGPEVGRYRSLKNARMIASHIGGVVVRYSAW